MAGRKTPGQKKKAAAPAPTPEVVCKPEGDGIVSKSGGGRVGAVVRARDAEREDGIDMAGIIGRAMMDQIPPEVMKRIAGYVEKGEKAVDDVVDYARQELTGPATEAGSYLKEAAGVAERGITGLAGQAGEYLENRDAGQMIDDLVDYGRKELTGPATVAGRHIKQGLGEAGDYARQELTGPATVAGRHIKEGLAGAGDLCPPGHRRGWPRPRRGWRLHRGTGCGCLWERP